MRRAAVPQQLGDLDEFDTGRDEGGRAGVSEVVKLDLRQVRGRQEAREHVAHGPGTGDPVRALRFAAVCAN
jgi:hypothetical protein